MYKPEEILFMQREAERLSLKYPAQFMLLSSEALAQIANGYGPDRWHEKSRKVLSWVFRKYPTPAAIHDVRYEFSDGSELTRKAADAEFAANLRLVWQARYGITRWINPAAWYGYWKITTAAVLTCKFGKSAWYNAYIRRKGRCENE